MMGSWRTTAGGVIAFLAVLFAQAAAMLDSDPLTVPNWDLLVGAAALLFSLWKARDNTVTSETVGAK